MSRVLRKLGLGACGVGLYVAALLSYQAYGRSQYTPEQLQRLQSRRDKEETTWQAAREAGHHCRQAAAELVRSECDSLGAVSMDCQSVWQRRGASRDQAAYGCRAYIASFKDCSTRKAEVDKRGSWKEREKQRKKTAKALAEQQRLQQTPLLQRQQAEQEEAAAG